MLVLHSKFSLKQLHMVDGKVNKQTKIVNEYCDQVIKDMSHQQLPLEPLISQTEHQLKEFITSPTSSRVLVFSHKHSSILQLFNTIALIAREDDGNVIPVIVDLTSIDSPTSKCVEKALQKHGLDEHTIEQSKKERKFIILVSGFERCDIHTNFYMCNEMSSWSGKVVFTCPIEFQQLNPNIHFYFMPASLKSPNFHILKD
jgi:hypothetical protein